MDLGLLSLGVESEVELEGAALEVLSGRVTVEDAVVRLPNGTVAEVDRLVFDLEPTQCLALVDVGNLQPGEASPLKARRAERR